MNQQDIVDMFMTPEGRLMKPAEIEQSLVSSWGAGNGPDRVGLAIAVPQLPGIYHVDKLQMLSDRISAPGTIIFSPSTMVATSLGSRRLGIDPHFSSIESQVDELRAFALDEGDAFSESSAARVLRFCHDLGADNEPAITLLANGNLRAVWQNQARDQIGIQFFPDGLLQYVMLRDRDGRTLKALGEDVSIPKVRAIAEAQGLIGLWFNGGR